MSKPNNYTPEINLSNLKDHTEQQVFDFVVAHLRKQGEQSNNSGGCAYRGYNEDGDTLMCAAGCLISDDQYTEEMDGSGDTTWKYLVCEGLVPGYHAKLIRRFQHIHDGFPCGMWEDLCYRLATEFNLTLEPKQ